MDGLRRSGIKSWVAQLVTFGLLIVSMHMPAAQAAMIGTDAIVRAEQAQQDRARLESLLDREEVKQRLLGQGVDAADVKARIDALSDSEAQTLAQRIDQLPAGGDGLGVLVFIFVLLLVTDLLGLTDVFPFVKKPVRR